MKIACFTLCMKIICFTMREKAFVLLCKKITCFTLCMKIICFIMHDKAFVSLCMKKHLFHYAWKSLIVSLCMKSDLKAIEIIAEKICLKIKKIHITLKEKFCSLHFWFWRIIIWLKYLKKLAWFWKHYLDSSGTWLDTIKTILIVGKIFNLVKK